MSGNFNEGVGEFATDRMLKGSHLARQVKTSDSSRLYIRPANEGDIQDLIDIDLMMFENAYGQEIPSRDEIGTMLISRMRNLEGGAGHMKVCELEGHVSGFASYFRTDKTWDDFISWEETTNNGTLNGVVVPEGKYAYVVNMTVTPQASAMRGMQRLMVNLIAEGMKENLKYGFFISRIPEFTKWLNEQGIDYHLTPSSELDVLAQRYVQTKTISRKGKEEPYDYELRTYMRSGFDMGSLVKSGFSDHESLDYGVTFRVPVPLADKPKFLRHAAAQVACLASRSTILMSRI